MAGHTNGKAGLAKGLQPPRTVCKICRCSVFAEDDTAWTRQPTPGIAHTQCVTELTETTKD